MLKAKPIAVLSILINLFFCEIILAETIILKSGHRVEARIIEKTDKYVKIDFDGMPLTYFLDEIERIEQEPKQARSFEEIAVAREKEAKALLEKEPESVRALNKRGIAYRMKGDQQAAITCFTKAIQIDPNDAESYQHRALSYGSSAVKQYDLALADYNKAIELSPDEGEYYFERATIYYSKEEYEKARNDVNKAKSLGFIIPPEFLQFMKKIL